MVRQAVRQAHGPEQSRRTHHLSTLSQPVESLKVERVGGQITMTEIQNSKQLAFDLIWDLDIVIWNLFGPILRSGGACNLLFPVYPGLGPIRLSNIMS